MANGKGAKRQRQKEMRRAKIEQEIKARQLQRRRQRMLALFLFALIAGGGAFYFMSQRQDDQERTRPAAAAECDDTKPPGGNTDTPENPPPMTIDKEKTYSAVIETSCGRVEVELAAETSPNTVNSFVFLARQGFYNGLPFHRIVKDFAVQGGDPKGDGTGGPKYKTEDPPPSGFKYEEGTVAMAKSGPEPRGTAGSQFFFVPGDGAASLPADYAVLGRVVKGQSAVEKLNNLETKDSPSGQKETPKKPVYIVKVTIRDSGGAK